jgi:hypothetical protein
MTTNQRFLPIPHLVFSADAFGSPLPCYCNAKTIVCNRIIFRFGTRVYAQRMTRLPSSVLPAILTHGVAGHLDRCVLEAGVRRRI